MVLCGHSHQQHLIQLPDGPLILNPGSVGCPSYDDPGAEPHVSEGGSPHARYAVLSIIGEQVSAEFVAISYDWNAAATPATPMGDQNGPTVYEQGGSFPVGASTTDVRSCAFCPPIEGVQLGLVGKT